MYPVDAEETTTLFFLYVDTSPGCIFKQAAEGSGINYYAVKLIRNIVF